MKRAAIACLMLLLGLPVAGGAIAASPDQDAANPGPANPSAVISVGPGKDFATPGEAAMVVQSGQTVRIYPGIYRDCAVWNADNITVEGVGDGVVMADWSCEGQALFIVRGSNVTVRNITFTGVHVHNLNGAGIRAAGVNLTVLHSRFEKNEEGILAAPNLASTIIIRDSYFAGNGNCIKACAHGIYIGRIAHLRVEGCEFFGQKEGHHIKSRALATEILNNVIRDGANGTASYLIDIPDGGSVLIKGNHMEKGPHSQNTTVIAIGAEPTDAKNETPNILVEDNDFTNDGVGEAHFVRNWTATPVLLKRNKFSGRVVPLGGPVNQ